MRGGAHIFGAFGQFVFLQRSVIDRRLDAGIEQFDNQRDKRGHNQHHAGGRTEREHKTQHQQHAVEIHQLAEALFGHRGFEAVHRIAAGIDDALQAGFALNLFGIRLPAVGFMIVH